MNEFVIVTDSSCDLTAELAEKYDIRVAPLSVNIDNKTYKNYLDGHDISPEKFYALLSDGIMATTSAVNVGEFEEVFDKILSDGSDILYIGFSSGLSGTYNSGKTAMDLLREKYPDRKMYAVDSLCASLGQGLLIYHAAIERENGKSIEEVRDYLEENKLHLCHWFTVYDLFHLKRGGRVSGATAVVGTVLNIKPVMHVDDEGHLVNVAKARGRQASINALFDKMKERVIDPENQVVFISHGNCLEDAQSLATRIKNELHVKDVLINFVGPVIGAHSGCGTLALFFLGTKR